MKPEIGTVIRGRKSMVLANSAQIIEILAAGNFARVACRVTGVSEEAYYQSLKKGEKARGKSFAKRTERDIEYLEFLEDVNRATATDEVICVDSIHRKIRGGIEEHECECGIVHELYNGPPDGRLALDYLKVRYRKRWGDVDPEPDHRPYVVFVERPAETPDEWAKMHGGAETIRAQIPEEVSPPEEAPNG